ncbi:hypothetical protein fugu_010106 [Takifugu bimaculatus]|uniref:Neurotransmitter-gated ion-channel ligand-binding domain-containing protein n=1 Tax=Takifugu bimaculatus TaxID=433685 RepID=A0A4Z2CEK8_9TELE|nr:hypothetical protein fugu_010106 [Takifugu bimaculatus]
MTVLRKVSFFLYSQRCPDFYKNKSAHFFLLLLVLRFFSSAIDPPPYAVSVQGPQQRFLLTELLKDYNPMERPVANDSQALTVQFSFILIQVMDVDEKNQIITTNAWLQMQWYDHYLQWNQSEYPGVKNLRFSPDQVWTPDILLYNSAHDKFDATFKANVLVNSSGYCEYLPPGRFWGTFSQHCHSLDVPSLAIVFRNIYQHVQRGRAMVSLRHPAV